MPQPILHPCQYFQLQSWLQPVEEAAEEDPVTVVEVAEFSVWAVAVAIAVGGWSRMVMHEFWMAAAVVAKAKAEREADAIRTCRTALRESWLYLVAGSQGATGRKKRNSIVFARWSMASLRKIIVLLF